MRGIIYDSVLSIGYNPYYNNKSKTIVNIILYYKES